MQTGGIISAEKLLQGQEMFQDAFGYIFPVQFIK